MTHSFLSPCISLAITQPAHPSGAVGAPDDLLPLLSECVSHTGTEGGSSCGQWQPVRPAQHSCPKFNQNDSNENVGLHSRCSASRLRDQQVCILGEEAVHPLSEKTLDKEKSFYASV